MRITWLLWLLCEICMGLLSASEWHVAVSGTSLGDGSQNKPWDLRTAFSHPAVVKPGDTVLLHGGRYYIGAMNSSLSGAAGIEIVVRSAPGEWAVLDTLVSETSPDVGQLNLYGGYCVYRDFEVTCTSTRSRVSTIPGSFPWDQGPGGNVFRGGVSVFGPAIHCVNLVVHDVSNGIFSGHTAVGGSIYGCTIYNIGWQGPDRGHGHANYCQNNGTAPKYVENNAMLNCYDDNLNFYGSDASFMKDLHCIDNISFGSGARNLAFTGECVISKAEIRGNILATSNKEDTLAVNSVAPWGKIGDDVTIVDNYIVGAIRFGQGFYASTITGNTVVGGRQSRFMDFIRVANSTATITNKYHGTGGFLLNSVSVGLSQWQAAGYDQDTRLQALPPPDAVVVRPNKWDANRKHITVLNWSQAKSFTVNPGLANGSVYEVRSAYDPMGTPIAMGTVAGSSITIPMGTVQAAVPISATAVVNPADIRFQAFIVTSTPGVEVPPEPPTPGKKKVELYRDSDGKLYTSEDGVIFKLLEVR